MALRPRMTAGVLLSRTTESGDRELAVVHRPRYDDWTWPKGGVEPGEHLAVAAAREGSEETGSDVTLGHRLGRTSYVRPGGNTEVHWWSATLRDGSPGVPDPDEVDEVRWVSAAEAGRLLTYPSDRNPLTAWEEQGPASTTVLVVRHASAGDRKLWSGPDARRPLDARGRSRAQTLAPVLRCFAPTRLVSATPLRCRETLEPLARALGAPIARDRRWDDKNWQGGPQPVLRAVAKLAGASATTAVCSQGETIPGVIAELARNGSKSARAAVRRASNTSGNPRSKKGSFWVLSFDTGGLVAADYVPD